MSDNIKNLKEINKLLNENSSLVQDDIEYFKRRAAAIKEGVDAQEDFKRLEEEIKQKVQETNRSFNDLSQELKSITGELSKQYKQQSLMTKGLKGMTNEANKLANEESNISSFNKKQLLSMQEKIKANRKQAMESAKSLLNDKGIISKRGIEEKRLQAEVNKLREDGNDKEADALLSAAGLRRDQSKVFDDLEKQLQKRIELEDKFNRDLGIGVKLAGGLDKALQKAGFPALGIAEAIAETKKEFITSNGKASILGGVTKKLALNLKDAASFANLAQLAFVALFKAMKDVDKEAGEFAKNQGISYEDTLALRGEMNKVAKASGDILVNSRDLMKTQASLNEFFGTSVKFTGEMASDFTQLTKRTNMTAETQGLMALEMSKTGKSAMQLTKELNLQTFELNNQKGVQMSVKQIQDAIGKTAASLQLTFKGSSKELANQVMSARALGTTLQGVEQISKSLLDFESSIQAELEAELLLGKDINLERARAAALQGDLATVAEEVMENQSIMEAFNTKNVIAQEKAAAALGMSREDLANMVLEQQKLEAVRAFGAENMNQAQKNYNDLRAQGLTAEQAAAEVGDEALANQLQSASVAERFEAITLRIQEIFIGMAEPILGMVEGMTTMVGGAENLASILQIIAATYIAIRGAQAISALLDRKKIKDEQKILGIKVGQATAAAVINPIAALAGVALAAVVGGMIYASIKDGMIAPDGGLVVSGPKGSIQLDKEDSIIAGTDLDGKKSGNNKGSGNNNQALVTEIRTLIGVNRQILAKSSVIEMNGNQVGQEINQSERAIQ
jgi:hypothetical protein